MGITVLENLMFLLLSEILPSLCSNNKKTQKTLLHSSESLQLYSHVHTQTKRPAQHGSNHFR